MKIESWIFGAGVFFFVPVALIYGFLTNWSEWVGVLGILLVGGLAGMIGAYLGFTGKRVGLRPEDRADALMQGLDRAGVTAANRIGTIVEGEARVKVRQ